MDEKKIEEIWMKLYERNEQYHDTKAKSVWLGGTVYVSFSLAVIKLITDNMDKVNEARYLIRGGLIAAISLVFLSVFWFVFHQIRSKSESAKKTGEFHKLLSKPSFTYEEMMKCTKFPGDKPEGRKERRDRRQERRKVLKLAGLPGFIILIPMTVIFVIQLLLMLGK